MQFQNFNGKAGGKIHPKNNDVMQWHTQAVNITTNIKIKLDFSLPELSVTNIVTWYCHVYYSSKDRYDIILGYDILTKLGFNLKFSEHVIKADNGPFKGDTTPTVYLGTHIFNILNTRKITPEAFYKLLC